MRTHSTRYDYLIVGAGLFGSVFAHEARKAGKTCLVVEKRPHTGGNIHCEEIAGINVHTYGAHIFHTDRPDIWQYVTRLVPFNRYTNSPIANYRGRLYNLPFNMNTFHALWGVSTPAEARAKIIGQCHAYDHITEPKNLEEQALKLCGTDIYHTLIKGYTEKQWGRPATQLPAFIIKRIPLRFTFDNNYFNAPYQGIPVGGYNLLTNRLLEGIEVITGINYLQHRQELDPLAARILYTGCIDEYFNCILGRLDYRSLRFEHKHLTDTDNFQGNAVVNYTDAETPYTRIIEHKHFEFGSQPTTVITYEYPDTFAPRKEAYYPINDDRNTALFARYSRLAAALPDTIFGGRLAQYTYADMDDTILAALELCRKELSR